MKDKTNMNDNEPKTESETRPFEALVRRTLKFRAWVKKIDKMLHPLGFYNQLFDRNGNGEAYFYLYGDGAFDDTNL